jgi:hypothetical protein
VIDNEATHQAIARCSLDNWPDESHATPKVFQGGKLVPMAEYAHNMTGVNTVKQMGLTGKGVKGNLVNMG